MLRKALTLGMVFILALGLLAVSMITCFTYDAEADGGHGGPHWKCWHDQERKVFAGTFHFDPGLNCDWYTQ